MKLSTISPKTKKALTRLLAAMFWLMVWQLAALAVGHDFLLASPWAVLKSLGSLMTLPGTWLAAGQSALRILLGFLAGFAFALLLAAGSFRYRLVRELAAPLVSTARAVPVASFVILAIILVSSRWLSTLVSFIIGFPVLYTGLLEGIKARNHHLKEMAKLFQVPFSRRLLFLDFPQILPFLRAGAVSALGMCWKSGIAAEVIGIPRGSIGEKLYSVKVNYLTAELFAWTVIIVLMSIASNFLLKQLLGLLQRRLDSL